MNKKNIFLLIIYFTLSLQLKGQDLNQTNTRYFPLYHNPALTGSFYGTLRFGGTYRDQGENLLGEGYKTTNLFIDAPISFSLRKSDWIGIGLQVYNDVAGTAQLETNGIILNGSYHLAFDKKYKNILSFGVQYGILQRKINSDKIVLASDHIDPGVTLSDRAKLSNFDIKINDINIGIAFKSKLSKTSNLILGISVYHMTKPIYEGVASSNYINRRFTLHSQFYFNISKRLALEPLLTASFSEKAFNIMPQIKTFFKLSKDKLKKDLVYFGLGYRLQDAMQIMMGMKYKNFDFGIAYDITISSAAKYNSNKGGIEFGIFKIIQVPKKRIVDPVLICPEL